MSRIGDTRSATIGFSARVGYTRVSTVAQTLDQQNEALTAAGVTKVFSDTLSGARDGWAEGRSTRGPCAHHSRARGIVTTSEIAGSVSCRRCR